MILLSQLIRRHPAASALDHATWNHQHDSAEQPTTALAVVQPPRNVHGDLYMECSSGIGEVHYVPDPPRWTTEPPTHPGLYAVRVDATSPRRVVEVYARDRELRFSWTDVPDAPVRGSSLLWSDRAYPDPVE